MSTQQDTVPDDPRDAQFNTENLKADLVARAGKNSTVVLLFALLKILVTLVNTAVLARLVAPHDHGVVAMAIPVITIAMGMSEFGLADALIQREKVTHRMATALFWMNAAIGAAIAVAVIALAYPAAEFYGDARVAPVFIALAPAILVAAMMAQFIALMRRQMRIRQIETILLLATIGSVVLAVGAALAGLTYWAIVVQQLSHPILSLLMLGVRSGWRPSRPSIGDIKGSGQFLKFGGYLALNRVIRQISQGFGTIMVGRMFSATEAGLYFRAWTLANIPPQRAAVPLQSVFLPTFSRAQNDPALFRSVFNRAATRISLITMPIGIGLCACADLITEILLGDQWLEAAPLLAWFGILTLQVTAMQTCQWALTAVGAVKTVFQFGLFSTVVRMAALFVGAYYGVVEMAAYSMLSFLVIQLPVLFYLCARHTPITAADLVSAFKPEVLCTVAAIGAIFMMRSWLPDLGTLATLAMAIGITLAVLMLRVLPNPALRGDILKVLSPVRRMIFSGS